MSKKVFIYYNFSKKYFLSYVNIYESSSIHIKYLNKQLLQINHSSNNQNFNFKSLNEPINHRRYKINNLNNNPKDNNRYNTNSNSNIEKLPYINKQHYIDQINSQEGMFKDMFSFNNLNISTSKSNYIKNDSSYYSKMVQKYKEENEKMIKNINFYKNILNKN